MAVRKVKSKSMSEFPHPIFQVLRDDPRYKLEAYQFVREALSFAQEVMGMGITEPVPGSGKENQPERHLTGQQLCEASRRYALDQYGLLAKTVLESWGISRTEDFGEIVYNLIQVDLMKKSDHDRREDFDGVFDFETGLTRAFEFTAVDEIEF